MQFRLITIVYVFALLAAAMATFGAWWGIAAALAVTWYWSLRNASLKRIAIGLLFGGLTTAGLFILDNDVSLNNWWQSAYSLSLFLVLVFLPWVERWRQSKYLEIGEHA